MRKSRKKHIKRRLIVISVFLLVIAGVWLHITYNVNPIIRTVSEEQVKALATTAVNDAALQVMNENPAYRDLVTVTKDDAGNITLIQANSPVISELSGRTTLVAQENIRKIGEQGIPIPLGSLSGLTFLTGKGPDINIKVLPVGSVATRFRSSFQSGGINQTLHKIFLEVSTAINVVMPGVNQSVNTNTEILITESIIIGKIPDIYFQMGRLDEMLNLVP